MRGRPGLVALALVGGAGCARKPEVVPEPQRFALGCPDLVPGWPPDSTAPLVIVGGIADLRFGGDTVGWARPEPREYEEEDTGFWESVLDDLFHGVLESLRDPIPLIAVPDAISVLRGDLGMVLERAGFRVVDPTALDSVPAGRPSLGGELRRLEAFRGPDRAPRGNSLVGMVAIELELRGGSPVPRWRRRFESEAEWKEEPAPKRADLESLVAVTWCDLLAQVEDAFRETDFSEAVRGEP